MKIIIFLVVFVIQAVFYGSCSAFVISEDIISSIQREDPEAEYLLGKLYYEHLADGNYSQESIKWLRKASEQNNILAKARLAVLLKREKNGEEARALFNVVIKEVKERALDGQAEYQVMMGLFGGFRLDSQQDEYTITEWYKRAAEHNEPEGQYYLGHRYKAGKGIQKDAKKAFEYFLKAAVQNHFVAQNEVGICYAKGIGVEKSYPLAINWYIKAAHQGYSWAQNNLGWYYKTGTGIPKDERKAFYWYGKAAEQKLSLGLNDFGICYLEGIGTWKNLEKAVNYFRDAATLKNKFGQYNLGRCYENGWGVKRDLSRAIIWYEKAAKQGHVTAKKNLEWLQ